MGNIESELNKNDKLSPLDKQRILEQNSLQQEIIQKQIFQGKIEQSQRFMEDLRHRQPLMAKSNNHLLTNPEVQKEFMRNKKMQQELQRRATIQQSNHIEDSSYNQINNFLSDLEVEETVDDVNKSHLFINQGTKYQNIVPDNNQNVNNQNVNNQNVNNQNVNKQKNIKSKKNKPEIGINNSDRDKLIRLIKKEKDEEVIKNKAEHDKRRSEYISKLNLLDENNVDPYKILDVSKTPSMTEIKNAYKKKAKIHHPDKGGNDKQFKIITMAFMSIIEKFKRQQQDKQFISLKDESAKEMENQNKNQRKNINMKGNNFSVKLFNKIYNENKIYNPSNEGYGKWMEETEFDSDTTPKIFSSEFNLNVFNTSFEDSKEDNSQEIIKYQEPQAISISKQNYQELGGDAPGNYTDSKKGYTDYRQAHSQTTLINPNNVKIKQYRNVDELNKARGAKMFLTEEETMVIERNKALEKENDEQRVMRLNKYDEMAFRQFEKVNKLFLK